MTNLITIIGPTASGKTKLAVGLAQTIGSEIISGDSRQVYQKMTIGTGKDLADYTTSNGVVPYHLIDIKSPGYRYNIYEYQRDFLKVYQDLRAKGKVPILCGGSGLYIETVLKGYHMVYVPPNKKLREELESYSLQELAEILGTYKLLHNHTDTDNKRRTIRAIEIADYYKTHPETQQSYPEIKPLIVAIDIDREKRRAQISYRLKSRLENGLIEEIQSLLDDGVARETLIYYGLEYKYVTLYLIGQLSYKEMFQQLEIAIHQYAKRQMTWFRGMEKRGLSLHWINSAMPLTEQIDMIQQLLKS